MKPSILYISTGSETKFVKSIKEGIIKTTGIKDEAIVLYTEAATEWFTSKYGLDVMEIDKIKETFKNKHLGIWADSGD